MWKTLQSSYYNESVDEESMHRYNDVRNLFASD